MLRIEAQRLFIAILAMILMACPVFGTVYECSECDGYSGWDSDDGGQPPDCDPKTSTRTLGSCEDASPETTTCEEISRATKMTRYYQKYQDVDCLIDCNSKLVVCYALCQTAPPGVKQLCEYWCDEMYDGCVEACIECALTSGPIPSDYEDGCI